ncbi:hypothetical protein TRFO_13780 [Tritrichomonas foetus]|uniref:Uncharacterized protein n=1 Tax=Tritrichomonas foetus TaxID=1144522 RepID=A0A1J4KX09_9EUKA|nr:hypothetical protein TRFO_13780 [Tritrichomonas foetus]|eukprot:OHT15787.1 hypothetical protein TRFO_13780 [Tritrichomonas foetus]
MLFAFLAFLSYSFAQKLVNHEDTRSSKQHLSHFSFKKSQIIPINKIIPRNSHLSLYFDEPYSLVLFDDCQGCIINVTHTQPGSNAVKLAQKISMRLNKKAIGYFFNDHIGQITIETLNSHDTQFHAAKIVLQNDQAIVKHSDFPTNFNQKSDKESNFIQKSNLNNKSDINIESHGNQPTLKDTNDALKLGRNQNIIKKKIKNQKNPNLRLLPNINEITQFNNGKIDTLNLLLPNEPNFIYSASLHHFTNLNHKKNRLFIVNQLNNSDNNSGKGDNTKEGSSMSDDFSNDDDPEKLQPNKSKKMPVIIASIIAVIIILGIIMIIVSILRHNRKYQARETNTQTNDNAENVERENGRSSSASGSSASSVGNRKRLKIRRVFTPENIRLYENSSCNNSNSSLFDTSGHCNDDGFSDDPFFIGDGEFRPNETGETEGYPENNFKQAFIEYRVPDETMLHAFLNEVNTKS